MAQADFDFASNGTGSITGGLDGQAVPNAALSDPLSGEGTYCRAFIPVDTNNIAMSATIKSSVNAGEFFEIPSTKSISVRAWLRHTDISTTTYAIGIGAKIYAGAPDADANAPNGYSVLIGDANQTSGGTTLKFIADNGAATFNSTVAFTVFDDTWHKVRLDVIPVGTSEDIVNVYTGTGTTGSEVWTLRYTKNILNSDLFYIPWAQTGNGKVGFWTVHDGSAQSMAIDRFQVFLEDV